MKEEYKSEFYESVRFDNQGILMDNTAFQESLEAIYKLWSFISEYGTIIFGRDFCMGT